MNVIVMMLLMAMQVMDVVSVFSKSAYSRSDYGFLRTTGLDRAALNSYFLIASNLVMFVGNARDKHVQSSTRKCCRTHTETWK